MTTVWSNTKLFDSELAQRLDSLALDQTKWKKMIYHFRETLVVAEEQTLYIIWPSGSARSIQIELDKLSKTKVVPTDKVNVAWALSPDKPYEPFVLFSYSKLVYIFNVHTKVIEGCLRGHGGASFVPSVSSDFRLITNVGNHVDSGPSTRCSHFLYDFARLHL